MGKLFSKYITSSSARNYASRFSNANEQTNKDNINETTFSSKAFQATRAAPNTNNMTEPTFNVQNTFTSFENVLNVNCVSSSTCVFGQNDLTLQLFDVTKNKTIKSWKGHEKDITKVLYCSKINKFVSSSRDKTIKMWSVDKDKYELNLVAHELVVTAISVNPDNDYLISGSRDNQLILWDLKSGKPISNANITRNLVTDLSWSSNGKYIIQSSEDKEIRMWDPMNLKVIHSFPKKQYIQSSCQISDDCNYAISSSNGFQGNGCEISIWDLRKRELLAELFGHEQTVTCSKLIQSSRYVVSCSNDSTVRLWDFKTHKSIDTVYLSNALTCVSEFQYSNNLVVSSLSNGIYLLNF